MNPVHQLSSARDRLGMANRKWNRRDEFTTSLARFGDLQSDRDLRAGIMRRVRRDRRAVNHAITACALLAFEFASVIFESGNIPCMMARTSA